MAGLLLELRKQIAGNRRKGAHGRGAEERGPYGGDGKRQPRYVRAEPGSAEGAAADTKDRQCGSTCERTQDIVNKDDFLLQQIDEFRDRAQQLQDLMNCREEEVRQLEQAREAEQARQEQEKERFERMRKRQTLADESLYASWQDRGVGIHEEQMQKIEQMFKSGEERSRDLTDEVELKIDEMIASVSAKLSELDASVRDSVGGEREISAQRAKELKESLVQIQEQLLTLKAELSDKVHTENVKCYRNIQELLKNMEKKLDALCTVEGRVASTRVFAAAALVFAVLDFAAIIGVLLVQLGIFVM